MGLRKENYLICFSSGFQSNSKLYLEIKWWLAPTEDKKLTERTRAAACFFKSIEGKSCLGRRTLTAVPPSPWQLCSFHHEVSFKSLTTKPPTNTRGAATYLSSLLAFFLCGIAPIIRVTLSSTAASVTIQKWILDEHGTQVGGFPGWPGGQRRPRQVCPRDDRREQQRYIDFNFKVNHRELQH